MRSQPASGCRGPQAAPDLNAPRRRLRRITLVVLAVAAGLCALFIALVAIDLLRIRHDLESGKNRLSNLDFGTVDEQGGIRSLATRAAADLSRADDRAESSPWLSIAASMPFVGNQIRGVRDVTRAANEAGALGLKAATDVQDALDRAGGAGPAGRIVLVDDLRQALDILQTGLRTIDAGHRSGLVGPIADARNDLASKLTRADGKLDDGRKTLTVLRNFLDGPRRYALLGGNNAEMRTTGIATTSSIMTMYQGNIYVGDFYNSEYTSIPKPGAPLPEGWDWLYGFLDPGTQYSNVIASPNFDRTGAVVRDISTHNGFGQIDGVLYIDTLAIQSLLSITGPVTIDGQVYDMTNAGAKLLNENYFLYAGPDPTQRREEQGRVAKAIFDALQTRTVPLLKLANLLQLLAKERHVLAWSNIPDEEQLWHDVGADGVRSPNDVLVSSQELGTSKLDYYVSLDVQMKTTNETGHRVVDISATVTNPVRDRSTPYIDGGSMYAKPGEYGYYLTVFVPRDAFDVTTKDSSWNVWARDGNLQAMTFIAKAPMGTSKTIDMTFSLPDSVSTINVVPSARVNPAQWHWIGHVDFDDRLPTTLDLSVAPTVSADTIGFAGWLVIGLALLGVGVGLAGTAWGRTATLADGDDRKRAGFDANIGWWMVVAGIAMVAVQMALFTLR